MNGNKALSDADKQNLSNLRQIDDQDELARTLLEWGYDSSDHHIAYVELIEKAMRGKGDYCDRLRAQFQ